MSHINPLTGVPVWGDVGDWTVRHELTPGLPLSSDVNMLGNLAHFGQFNPGPLAWQAWQNTGLEVAQLPGFTPPAPDIAHSTTGGDTMNPLLLMLATGGLRGGLSKILPFLLMTGGGAALGLGAAGAGGLMSNPLLLMTMMGGNGGGNKALIGYLLGGTTGLLIASMSGGGRRSYRRRRYNYRRY